MFQGLSALASILLIARVVAPALIRYLALGAIIRTVLSLIGGILTSPWTWIGAVIASASFPDFIGSIMELVGAGLIRIATITFHALNSIMKGTGIGVDYESLTQLTNEMIAQLPTSFIEIGGYFHFVSLLGVITSTLAVCATVNVISSLVRRY